MLAGWLLAPVAFAGSVEGRVTDALTGEPLAGAVVRLSGSGNPGISDADGFYTISDVPAGDFYYIYIDQPPEGYVGEVYFGGPCFGPKATEACAIGLGGPVEVPEVGVTSGINFALDPDAVISGTVLDLGGSTAVTGEVTLYSFSQDFGEVYRIRSVVAEADGSYSFSGLPAGFTFYVVVEADGFVDQVWDDIPCLVECVVESGTAIVPALDEDVAGIDFNLVPESAVGGLVEAEGTGEPIPNVVIWLHDSEGTFLDATSTGADGRYRFFGLPQGTYYLRTFANFFWADELYGGQFCPQADGTCDVTEGVPILLTAPGSVVENIDLALAEGGRITGTVRSAGGRTLSAVIDAWSGAGERVRITGSGEDGRYEISGLAPGDYFVTTRLVPGYKPQLYDELPCGDLPEPDCDVTAGTPVSVTLGEATANIDFALERQGFCQPSATVLCLNSGRFAVEARWTTREGETGPGVAVNLPQADDSGYFWFFEEDNAEVLVKVLDGCGTSFNSFWVFAAGLTNVEVVLTVTDTVSTQQRTYTNPLRTPFQPIQDTRAFMTCP
ncbi:MAG: carboxypeptidase regulatory-like domain-containing protein [Acidobacteriota bacterium]|nr:carboxypeptidase regulatory-like domain-containing protein [Acidobacteriota bacterium]